MDQYRRADPGNDIVDIYSTTKTTTESKDDGSTVISIETDDGHGNTDNGQITIKNTGRPGPDDDGGAAEERPFAHTVFVGKSLDWQLSAPEPGEAGEGVPLATIVRGRLGDLIGAIVGGGDSGWGDAASEGPRFPPIEDVSVGGEDDDAWGIIHPQALIGRALRYGRANASTRASRESLRQVAALLAEG
jgi:hypothetical protein